MGENEILNSWNPIHFCKTYTNHKMARMMGIYLLLPSGVKDSTVKVSVLGKTLTVTVAMPGMLENAKIIHGYGLDTEEYAIRTLEYNKALNKLLGHKKGERVWWTARINLPQECANNNFQQRIMHGKSTGTSLLCLDMLVEDSTYNSMNQGVAISVDDSGLDD